MDLQIDKNIESVLLATAFSGLAFLALKCPCDIIFKCHREIVLAALAGLFGYIFIRTG